MLRSVTPLGDSRSSLYTAASRLRFVIYLHFNDPKCYNREISLKSVVLCACLHKLVSWWNCTAEKSLIATIKLNPSGWDLWFFRVGRAAVAGSTLGHFASSGVWGNFISGAVAVLFFHELMLRKLLKHFRCKKRFWKQSKLPVDYSTGAALQLL